MLYDGDCAVCRTLQVNALPFALAAHRPDTTLMRAFRPQVRACAWRAAMHARDAATLVTRPHYDAFVQATLERLDGGAGRVIFQDISTAAVSVDAPPIRCMGHGEAALLSRLQSACAATRVQSVHALPAPHAVARVRRTYA
jgi:hypothetical protein